MTATVKTATMKYMLAFLTFIRGYKRWNRKYQEGYAVDEETDDSEKPPVKGLIGIICGNRARKVC